MGSELEEEKGMDIGGLSSDILVGSVSSWVLFGGAGLQGVHASRAPELLPVETLLLVATDDGTHALPMACSGVGTFSLGPATEAAAASVLSTGCCGGGGTLEGRNVVGACPVLSGAGEAEGSVLHVVVTVEIAVVMVLVLGTHANNCFLTDDGVRLLVTQSGWEDATADEAVPGQLEAKPVDSDCRMLPF